MLGHFLRLGVVVDATVEEIQSLLLWCHFFGHSHYSRFTLRQSLNFVCAICIFSKHQYFILNRFLFELWYFLVYIEFRHLHNKLPHCLEHFRQSPRKYIKFRQKPMFFRLLLFKLLYFELSTLNTDTHTYIFMRAPLLPQEPQ